ncbi:DNA repair protein RecO [Candidatus Pelagibacter sp.]|jgi:DNA repair protein RecO (recombination protein O)|nr:DNA repair protein RecO [Candidatus Pelagibacter sp.]|tara:strand:- start:1663 stop:2343 length:681 start_codon:yes stop_codon:yes gene_type:complete
MYWSDAGYILSNNRYNENSSIVEFFTQYHGRSSGIIFGATSKKIKSYLQIGNKLHLDYNFKNESRLGYFKVEIITAHTPLYFDNYKKLSCIVSAMNLIKLFTAESQENYKIYNLIEDFFNILNSKDWIKEYIFWELKLLKLIGYHLELSKIATKEISNNQISYYAKSSFEKKIIPNFLINLKEKKINNASLLSGLKLVGDYMEKTILKPNDINYPNTRIHFINSLK